MKPDALWRQAPLRKAKRAALEDTFHALALEWLQMQEKSLGAQTFKKKKERLEAFAFPY